VNFIIVERKKKVAPYQRGLGPGHPHVSIKAIGGRGDVGVGKKKKKSASTRFYFYEKAVRPEE